MNAAGYIFAGYTVTAVVVGGYVAIVLRRGRALARSVPPDERPWARATAPPR